MTPLSNQSPAAVPDSSALLAKIAAVSITAVNEQYAALHLEREEQEQSRRLQEEADKQRFARQVRNELRGLLRLDPTLDQAALSHLWPRRKEPTPACQYIHLEMGEYNGITVWLLAGSNNADKTVMALHSPAYGSTYHFQTLTEFARALDYVVQGAGGAAIIPGNLAEYIEQQEKGGSDAP